MKSILDTIPSEISSRGDDNNDCCSENNLSNVANRTSISHSIINQRHDQPPQKPVPKQPVRTELEQKSGSQKSECREEGVLSN